MLNQVWARVRVKYPDAVLLSVSGRTAAEGAAICDSRYPMTDGWRYHFHSPKTNTYQLMGRCASFIEGPFKEYRSVRGDMVSPIEGSFIDSDRVFAILRENQVPLDPADYHGGGRRPFTLNLFSTTNPRFKAHPVLWEISVGKSRFLINASTQKLVRDPSGATPDATDSGLSSLAGPDAGPGQKGFSVDGKTGKAALAARPAKTKVYTAKADLAIVFRHVRARLPGASLMAVDALADAWGSVTCAGTGDGWAYHFYVPRTHAVETIYACNGRIEQGQSTYTPVDMGRHESIPRDFVDSSKAVDLVLADEPNIFDEGMGRRHTRTMTLRLLRYRSSPFIQENLWRATFLWELEAGRRIYYVDAGKGLYLGARDGR